MSREVSFSRHPETFFKFKCFYWFEGGKGISLNNLFQNYVSVKVPDKVKTNKEILDENYLLKEEDVYRLIVENVKDYAIFMLDKEGRVATWNEGAKKIKGYSKEEILGQHFSVFYTKKDIDSRFPWYELEVAAKEGRFENEGWRVKKDGSLFWANVVITALFNKKKELVGFAKVTRDLSDRKKAEDNLFKAYQELQASEEKYRLLVDVVKDYAIFMLDPIGNVATWNEGAKRIKGYEAEEILGKHFSRFYPQEVAESGFPEFELKEAASKGRFEDTGWRVKKDGTFFWANVVITAIHNSKKELIGFSKVTRDLTEKKKLEEQLHRTNDELKENEERMRLMIDSVKDYAIIILNPDGFITNWNSGAERINGYKSEEIIGKHFSKFYTREAIENGFPQFELRKALEDGRFEDEGWRVRKDGNAFWANIVISPIYNAHKKFIGFSKITRDLTERRRNEELMNKNQELLRLNTELDSFIYSASHDLKAPIANIEGLIMTLKEDMGAEVETHKYLLSLVDSSIERFKTVIAELTEVSKVHKEESDKQPIDVKEIYEQFIEGLQDTIKYYDPIIEEKFSGPQKILFSKKNFRSILYNLISNALKYSSPERRPHIIVSTEISGDGLFLLKVTDNGLGIERGQISKVFAMFKRLHDHVEGTGLGLYIVKKIIDNARGKIDLESELGKGTTFNIYLNVD